MATTSDCGRCWKVLEHNAVVVSSVLNCGYGITGRSKPDWATVDRACLDRDHWSGVTSRKSLRILTSVGGSVK